MQEFFERWNHHKALLGKMPVESQGSTDPFVSHQYEGCCVHKRVRLILATLEQKEGRIKLLRGRIEHTSPVACEGPVAKCSKSRCTRPRRQECVQLAQHEAAGDEQSTFAIEPGMG